MVSDPFYSEGVGQLVNPTNGEWVVRSDPFYIGSIVDGVRRNPTSRQCVDRSSPFYRTSRLPRNRESHITAVCGWFKSFLPDETASGESGIPHHGSVWMVQVLSSKRALP